MIDPSNIAQDDGTQEWRVDGRLHRLDAPAVVWADGTQFWYVNDQCHRTDGPAFIRADGTQEWYVNGQDITAQVLAWMQQQGVSWPWDAATQMQFQLTWG